MQLCVHACVRAYVRACVRVFVKMDITKYFYISNSAMYDTSRSES